MYIKLNTFFYNFVYKTHIMPKQRKQKKKNGKNQKKVRGKEFEKGKIPDFDKVSFTNLHHLIFQA